MRRPRELIVSIGCLIFGALYFKVNRELGIIGLALGVIVGLFYIFGKKIQDKFDKTGNKPTVQDLSPKEPETDDETDDSGEDE